MLRIRRRWRLRDLAGRSGLSPATLARHELGAIASVERLRRHAAALDARLELRLIGRGAEIPRLHDDEHAAIVDAVTAAFLASGWQVEAEASFNEWGERGRMDLLARRPAAAARRPAAAGGSGLQLVVVEVKTEVADLQDLLGSLDVKERLAPTVARRLGWPIGPIGVVLAVASTSRNRSIVAAHPALFRAYTRVRLRHAASRLTAVRTLLWVPPAAAGRRQWLAGRRRVRRSP
jgi:transcriptional regulator with XRE-family HTH domain